MPAKSAKTKNEHSAPAPQSRPGVSFPFTRVNFLYMLLGIAVIVLGYLLMVGGGSDDPHTFDASQVYSWRRITLAPIVIILGFLVEVYAIMKRPKDQDGGA